MSREDVFRAKEKYLLTDQSATVGTLLDGTNCKILLDSVAKELYVKAVLPKNLCIVCLSLPLKLKWFRLGMVQVAT